LLLLRQLKHTPIDYDCNRRNSKTFRQGKEALSLPKMQFKTYGAHSPGLLGKNLFILAASEKILLL